MGLGYLILAAMLAAFAGSAIALVKSALGLWKLPRRRAAAVLLLLLALLCGGIALYLLGILWREAPWRFHF